MQTFLSDLDKELTKRINERMAFANDNACGHGSRGKMRARANELGDLKSWIRAKIKESKVNVPDADEKALGV